MNVAAPASVAPGPFASVGTSRAAIAVSVASCVALSAPFGAVAVSEAS